MIKIYNDDYRTHIAKEQRASYHLVVADPPFNISEVERNTLEDRPSWDTMWSPLPYVRGTAKLLAPGGWSITKTSDRLLGPLRDVLSGDHSTTRTYLDWLWGLHVLSDDAYNDAVINLSRQFAHLPYFEYKATVTWLKKSGPYLRDNTYLSRAEWFTIAKRLDESGMSVKAPAWQFLSVSAMRNWFICPPCGAGERLYWHLVDPYEEDGQTKGTIVPCKDPKSCDLCAKEIDRVSHPCQTPTFVWRWFLERHAKKSLRLFDPFAGVGSLAKACQELGIEYTGCETNWVYATIAQMWTEGVWGVPEPEAEIEQLSMFGDDSEIHGQ